MYRSKEIMRDLNRPLLGVIVNLLEDPKAKKHSKDGILGDVGVRDMDNVYRLGKKRKLNSNALINLFICKL